MLKDFILVILWWIVLSYLHRTNVSASCFYLFLEKFILFKILNIVFYVIENFGKFGIVPDDIIIKTVLPVEINTQSVCLFGNG